MATATAAPAAQSAPDHRITLELRLPVDFLKDVLVTAAETPGAYGIGYWAHVMKVTKGSSSDYTEVRLAYDLREKEEGNRKGRFVLGLAELAQGIYRILNEPRDAMKLHPSNVGRVMAAVLAKDAGQLDGEAVDWIVQAAVFNEQVYG